MWTGKQAAEACAQSCAAKGEPAYIIPGWRTMDENERDVEYAKVLYVRGDIEVPELERRIGEALARE